MCSCFYCMKFLFVAVFNCLVAAFFKVSLCTLPLRESSSCFRRWLHHPDVTPTSCCHKRWSSQKVIRRVLPKYLYLSTRLRSISSQKKAIFIVSDLSTSDLASTVSCWRHPWPQVGGLYLVRMHATSGILHVMVPSRTKRFMIHFMIVLCIKTRKGFKIPSCWFCTLVWIYTSEKLPAIFKNLYVTIALFGTFYLLNSSSFSFPL
jgi:hypothetical protein